VKQKQFSIRFEARTIAEVKIRVPSLEEARKLAYEKYLEDGLAGRWKQEQARLLQRGSNQWVKRATHCARGHEYTPENTIERPCSKHRNGIKRQCRTCKAESMRVRRQDLRRADAELRESAETRFDARL